MLREISVDYPRGRLIAGSYTSTATPSITANLGQDFTLVRTGTAGRCIVTFKQPFRVNPFLIAQNNSLSGGYVSPTAFATSTVQIDQRSSGDVFTDGTVDFLLLGYDQNTVFSKTSNQKVKSSLRETTIVGGQIAGATGTVNIGKRDFSVTRTAQGAYTVTFLRAFSQNPVILMTPIGGAVRDLRVTSRSASGCTIECADATPALQDVTFNIVVVGTTIRDQHYGAFRPARNTQRKPRILAGSVSISGGNPVFTSLVNSSSGFNDIFTTLTKQSSGDFSVNYLTSFKREPIVIASSFNAARCRLSTSSSTGVRIQSYSSSNTLTDPGVGYNFFVIGSDDVSEY